jgi:uncharacterized protein (TIGR02466 family)
MAIRAWFPTLIYEAPLDPRKGRALARALLEDALKVRRHDAEGRAWCRKNYPHGFTSYASMNRLHRSFSTFGELERRLDRHVGAFVRRLEMNLGKGRLEMSDCWVNFMGRHALHPLHFHPLSVISGTCYVRTPRGGSRIRFEDPRADRFMAAPPRPERRAQAWYEAKEGNVLLFESWLRHEVAPHPVGAERVSVSFNYDWVPGVERERRP